MKNTFLKLIGTAALAILMLAMFAQVQVSAQDITNEAQSDELINSELSRGRNARDLEGSWNVQVTLQNCQTGEAIRTFSAMNTFMQGGTMQEFSVGAAPLARGPGHGVWRHQGGRRYSFAFQFFRFNADGTYAGTTRGRRAAEISRSGDSYSATATLEVFNPAGVLVATGCAAETATRFE